MQKKRLTSGLLRIACALVAILPSAHGLADIESSLRRGASAYVRGDYRDAASAYEDAVSQGGDGALQALALSGLATVYWLHGRYGEADGALRRVIAFAGKTYGPDHPNVARELSRLGALLRAQGRYAEADAVLQKALQILEAAYGVDHAYVAECLYGLAEASRLRGRYEEAERRYWRAFMIRSYLHGPDSSAVGEALGGLAAVKLARGSGAEAQTLFQRALAIAEKRPRGNGTWGRLDERDLRELLPPERETHAVRGQMYTRDGGPRHIEFAQHFDSLADLYRALGRFSDAEHHYRRAIAIREKHFGPDHPEIALALGHVALMRGLRGDPAGGLEVARTAATVLAKRRAAEGERWRPVFLTMLSLLVADARLAPQQAAAEGFAAIQLASVGGAADFVPMPLAEAQALLGPDETLVAVAAGEQETYVASVRRNHAELRRVGPAPYAPSGAVSLEALRLRGKKSQQN